MWTTTSSPPFDPRNDKPGFDRGLGQFAIAVFCLVVLWLLTRGCGSAVHTPQVDGYPLRTTIAVQIGFLETSNG